MKVFGLGWAVWWALIFAQAERASAQAAPGQKAPVPRIVYIAHNLDRGDTADNQDQDRAYYLDQGEEANINEGDVLNVYREIKVGPRILRVFIGTMTMVDVQVGSAMGRFSLSPAIAGQPLIRYKTALVNDVVMPRIAINSSVLFDPGQFSLKPGVATEFDKVGEVIKNFPTAKVLIEGHTDSDGDAQTNKKLSEQRAEAVRLYLINTYNIPAARIEAKGAGEERPIVPNDTPENKALNRRIEVTVWE